MERVRAEQWPDYTDEVMYPRLSDATLQKLPKFGERRSYGEGELLFAQGVRDAPFMVVERGGVLRLIAPRGSRRAFRGAHRGRRRQLGRAGGDVPERRMDCRAAFLMIGAEPCTEPVAGVPALDDSGYLLCGPPAAAKRVASAGGDGALAVRFAHQVLAG